MARYPYNHYILLLQNNYTKQKYVKDVYNTSNDKLFYDFKDFEFDEGAPFGEYSYVLIWCVLDYSLEISNNLLDSKLTIEDKGEEMTYLIRDLSPDTGTILYPDPNKRTIEQAIDEPVSYYSL